MTDYETNSIVDAIIGENPWPLRPEAIRIAPEFAHRAVAKEQWDNPMHLFLFLAVFWGLIALGLWWWLA